MQLSAQNDGFVYLSLLLLHGYFLFNYVVTSLGDYMDMSIERYRASIKGGYFAYDEELGKIEKKQELYMQVIEMLLRIITSNRTPYDICHLSNEIREAIES